MTSRWWRLFLAAAATAALWCARPTTALAQEDEPAAEPTPVVDEPAPEPAPPEEDGPADEGPAAAAEPDGPAAAADDERPAAAADGDERPAEPAEPAGAAAATDDDDDRPDDPAAPAAAAPLEYDADGDGVYSPEEAALGAAYAQAYGDIPEEVTPVEPGQADLAAMMESAMSTEEFRALVDLAKRKVLARLEAKMAAKQAERMGKISWLITLFSLAGLLLLATPLVLRRRYPGRGGLMFKYSALAAVTFVVTVNLFGMVVVGMRSAQGAMGRQTNPQLRIAEGFFSALHRNADQYRPMAKQLFGPTLRSLDEGGDQQPAAVLLENGGKLIQDAKSFVRVAKVFKKVDFAFALLPIVLLGVTLLIFILAIKPTLVEIITMPARMAAGTQTSAMATVKLALRRLGGEVGATACTLVVLFVLTTLSATVLGRLLPMAIDSLIQFFGAAILYLQVDGHASSGVVFAALFGVVLFLALNLAVIVLSSGFFLGKVQKIFQARWNGGVPLAAHREFWTWGSLSLIVAQLVPFVFMFVGWKLVDWFASRMIGDGSDIKWKTLFLGGVGILVVGFLVTFWAARGLKGLVFLARYKVAAPAPAPPQPPPIPTRVSGAPTW